MDIVEEIKKIIGNNYFEEDVPTLLKETFERVIKEKIIPRENEEFFWVEGIKIENDSRGNEYLVYNDYDGNILNVIKDGIEYDEIPGIKIRDSKFMKELEITAKDKILGKIIGAKREQKQDLAIENMMKEKERLTEELKSGKISAILYAIKDKEITDKMLELHEIARTEAKEEYEEQKNSQNSRGEQSDTNKNIDDIYSQRDWIQIMLDKYSSNIKHKYNDAKININVNIAENEGPKRGRKIEPTPRHERESKPDFEFEKRIEAIKSLVRNKSEISVNNGEYTCFYDKIDDGNSRGYIVIMEPENYEGKGTKIGFLPEEDYLKDKEIANKKGENLREVDAIAQYVKETLETTSKSVATERVNHGKHPEWFAIMSYYVTGDENMPKVVESKVAKRFAQNYPAGYLSNKRDNLLAER